MPSSLIYSILETSSQSRMAPSPESASVAWKPRSARRSQNVNMVGWMMKHLHYTNSIMLSDSGESSPLGTTGWDVCRHCQRHTSQSHRPRHHRHCGREESWHLFLWSETCRYWVQPRAKNILPTCCICVFMFDACIIVASRSNCGAADRDGSACRQDSGLPGPRTGRFLTPSVWSG